MTDEPTVFAVHRTTVQGGTLSANDVHVDVGTEPCIVGRSPGCHLVLRDPEVSAIHFEAVATPMGVRIRDCSRNGTYLAGGRITEVCLSSAATLMCGRTVVRFQPGKRQRLAHEAEAFGDLVGATPDMREVFRRLRRIAPTELSVLIQGETGTGKELVAKAIHEASPRASGPFVVIDCGSIPTGLAESVLFGHERGAFTGAVARHTSPFVEASGGTVFLDELGELPLEVQPKLLRALAEGRVKSVGSNRYTNVDARVIGATHHDLMADINREAFRSDLYFRVAQVKIELPPLRRRKEDIPLLVRHLLRSMGRLDALPRITSMDRLLGYPWPGNVRELQNVVAAAVAYDEGGPIDLAEHLTKEALGAAAPALTTFREHRAAADREYFLRLYLEAGGNVRK